MPDIELQTKAGPLEALLEIPTGTGPWPGVVVIHDLSYRRDTRDITRMIADNGYIALSPNLFSRGGVVRCVSRVMLDLQRHSGRAIDDIDSARDFLSSHDQCTGSTGIAGFCLGGGFALVMAKRGFDAAAPFYPSLFRQDYHTVLDGACPVVASLGGRDPLLRNAGERLERSLTDLGIPHDVKTYPEAGHGFANSFPGDRLLHVAGFGHYSDATQDSWNRVFEFFDTHLH